MYRKYLKPQDLIRHEGSEFYWEKKKNHDCQKPPALREHRWGSSSKRDKTQIISLKGEKPGECSVLDLKWSMSKRNDWWTMSKPAYSSKKIGDDDLLLDNNDEDTDYLDYSYGIWVPHFLYQKQWFNFLK